MSKLERKRVGTNKSAAILFNENSALLPVTRQKLVNLQKTLKRDKLTPWLWFNSRGVKVTDFYGETVCQQGISYGEQQWNVFWDFVKPFLENAIVKTLDDTIKTCRTRELKPEEPYIREAAALLDGYLIDPICRYMVDIDRRIRGRGSPASVKRRDVTDKIDEMVRFLDKCKDEMIQGINEQAEAKQTAGGNAGDDIQTTSETTKPKVEAIRDQVFICYSHKDKRWLNDMQTHLKPYVRNGSITAWSDKQIAPGSKWLKEIEVALASTKVAVLLVTPNFLASDFIHENELGPLLKKAEKGKLSIIWVPVRACAYKETPLKDYQAAVDPEKPLANMKAERDKSWVKICEEIKKAVNR